MFLPYITESKDQEALLRLCFAVATAETCRIDDETKEILTKIGFEDTLLKILLWNPVDDSYKMYGMVKEEALMLMQLCSLFGLSNYDVSKVMRNVSSIDTGMSFEDCFRKFVHVYTEEFPPLIQKKLLLFETCVMAFRDGSCSDSERLVLKYIAEDFGIDEDTMSELINQARSYQQLFKNTSEIISE